jgi:hypothetical protein
VAPIQPASVGEAGQKWILRSLARQSPLLLAKEKKNDPPLKVAPELRKPIGPEPPFGVNPVVVAPTNPKPNARTAPEELPAAASSEYSALIQARANRALALAVPLRRALIKSGCRDVLDTAFDGAPIVRALNNRRLSQRTLDALQEAVGQILHSEKLAADDANLKAATLAAARVGQTLGYRGVIAVAAQPRSGGQANRLFDIRAARGGRDARNRRAHRF